MCLVWIVYYVLGMDLLNIDKKDMKNIKYVIFKIVYSYKYEGRFF